MRHHIFVNEIHAYTPRERFGLLIIKKTSLQISYKIPALFLLEIIFLLSITGCVSVPRDSNIGINDNIGQLEMLQHGDVIVVYGENAPRREENLSDYFSCFCMQSYGNRDVASSLITFILKLNPQPGLFAVKNLSDVQKDNMTTIYNSTECVENSILCKLGISNDKVLSDHLRYAIHVKEEFQPKLHLPLYAFPIGIASCSHKTVLEAEIFDLKSDKHIGSFTVSAEGEITVAAYFFHVAIDCDTQRDAINKLARDIVTKFTGLSPLQED